MDTPGEPSRPKPVVRTGGRRPSPGGRLAEWTVGVAAVALLLVSLVGWLFHRTQLADIAADHLRLQVSGPARLRPGMTNEFAVRTTSVTGRPVSAQVECAVYSPDGQRVMGHKEKTDEDGRLTVAIPSDVDTRGGVRLEVSASRDGREEKVTTLLAAEPIRHVTQVALDRPIYRPGETIHFRSLTLSCFRLEADREMVVEYEIFDPGGAPLDGSRYESETRQGVGSGQFRLPDELAGGKYTLVARSPDDAFPEERQTFFVGQYRLPRLSAKVEFARASYGPGEKVAAEVSAERAQGAAAGGTGSLPARGGQARADKPPVAPGGAVAPSGGAAAGAELTVVAVLDGQTIHEQTAAASAQGTFHVEFSLPEEIGRGDGQLVVVADDGGLRETVARTIPIHLGQIDVRFYPEGGDLVAGLESRVYFAVRDPLGRPVELRGRVLDSQDRQVAEAATAHRGMGAFTLVPSPNEDYRLVIDGSAGEQEAVRLPQPSTRPGAVLSAGLGVFEARQPLEFNVRASKAGMPLVALAWCRGMPVGQQVFVTHAGEKANPVAIPLADEANGVIRLTIYDYSVSPPEPVAERLVYRRPARRLNVEIGASDDRHSPGGPIALPVSVSDEQSRPIAATLGVRVAPEALLSLAGDEADAIRSQFLLATELDRPEDLGDVAFCLSGSREAAVALDLVLGTQPWRRLLTKTLPPHREGNLEDKQLARMAALGARPTPPAMFDNLIELQERYRESLAAYRAHQTRASNTITALSFLGGLGLVIFVAMLNMLNVAGGARLWATAIGTATVCLIVGGILMDPGRWKSPPEGAVPYFPYDAAPAELSKASHVGHVSNVPTTQGHVGNVPHVPGVVQTDPQGRAQLRFRAPEPPGTFDVLVDADAEGGRLGSARAHLAVGLPLELDATLPPEASPGDRIDVPAAVVNSTDGKLSAEIAVEHGDLVQLEGSAQGSLEIAPQSRARRFFPLLVAGQGGECPLKFRATAGSLAGELTASLRVVPPDGAASAAEGAGSDNAACPVRLSTRLEKSQVAWGRTVALTVELTNTSGDSQPMTVAVLGLPAGLEVRREQLEELVKDSKLNHYETRPREVLCYWSGLDAGETVGFELDPIAAVPGKFTGPASSAYLRDAPDRRHWSQPLAVEVTHE